jgi:hypothetical protein
LLLECERIARNFHVLSSGILDSPRRLLNPETTSAVEDGNGVGNGVWKLHGSVLGNEIGRIRLRNTSSVAICDLASNGTTY